ncbi:hypothetical protein QTH87_09420 [Variovorax sp. J22P168]|uniref:hypothetical protein n=1 Tax=Variovorax jilinensis TaxID=3053513 RepID=UPI0025760B13|nr:hypothetical protein [Variovorax sp. J22P168]MDM0012647.1 hypothetical protein [Variovorax sp. J22P168]
MHSAPSVNYPVGRSRRAERLLMALWALGVASVTAACLADAAALDWRQAMLAASAVVAGVAAWTGVLRSSAAAELGFDGHAWSMSGEASRRNAGVCVALDLQSLMLVRLVGPGRAAHWIWLDREALPERWLDLRRALYARPGAAAPVSAPAPGARHSSP